MPKNQVVRQPRIIDRTQVSLPSQFIKPQIAESRIDDEQQREINKFKEGFPLYDKIKNKLRNNPSLEKEVIVNLEQLVTDKEKQIKRLVQTLENPEQVKQKLSDLDDDATGAVEEAFGDNLIFAMVEDMFPQLDPRDDISLETQRVPNALVVIKEMNKQLKDLRRQKSVKEEVPFESGLEPDGSFIDPFRPEDVRREIKQDSLRRIGEPKEVFRPNGQLDEIKRLTERIRELESRKNERNGRNGIMRFRTVI